MSMESDLSTLLKTICPRVYPDLAPVGTVTPYVTWQAIGGTAIRFGDGSAPDKRNTLMQINVWSKTRLEALTMIRQIEDAVCAYAGWQAEPQGEAISLYEPDTQLYGSIQTLDIWSNR